MWRDGRRGRTGKEWGWVEVKEGGGGRMKMSPHLSTSRGETPNKGRTTGSRRRSRERHGDEQNGRTMARTVLPTLNTQISQDVPLVFVEQTATILEPTLAHRGLRVSGSKQAKRSCLASLRETALYGSRLLSCHGFKT